MKNLKEKYDVIVVGSGAGGASLAYDLVQSGKKVLIIEAGSFFKSKHLGTFWPTVIFPGAYYRKWAAFSMSKEFTTVYHTRNVGGTTVVNCGNMVRSCQQEFLNIGIDLEAAFQVAEKDLGVAPLSEKKIVTGTKAIVEAAKRKNYNMVPMPKGLNNGKVCDLCGDCVLGCHTGRKWDARAYIDEAMKLGAELFLSTRVKRVQLEINGQVIGVETDRSRIIKANQVVLAAGALNTPVILQDSNIDSGRGMFINPFNATYGITNDLSQTEGASMGAVCKDFHENSGFILSPYIDHWSQLMLWCPPWWNIINRFPRKRIIGIMTKIADERTGQVFANGSFSKKLTDQDKARLRAGAEISKKILQEAGAKNVITTKHPRGAHPGGTAAVGKVVGNDLQVKGTQGLYVCDASLFPVTSGLPPILTIVALAKWLAVRL